MSNEAAERLQIMLDERSQYRGGVGSKILDALDAALAAERRATVERLRKRLGLDTIGSDADIMFSPGVLQKILDEVAE